MTKSYHAYHILVQHQYQAEDLAKKLAAGASFEELAKKHSTCSSASRGGDLGEIKVGKADPDFEEHVLNMKPGELNLKALRSRFGYHLVFRKN